MTVSDPPGVTWRKSSRSGGNNGACVEVGFTTDTRAVRDTKNRAAGYLTTTPDQWSAFLTAIKTGRFED